MTMRMNQRHEDESPAARKKKQNHQQQTISLPRIINPNKRWTIRTVIFLSAASSLLCALSQFSFILDVSFDLQQREINNEIMPSIVPDYAVARQRERRACAVASTEYLKSMQEPWRRQGVPLLASVLLSTKLGKNGGPPGEDAAVMVYHLFFAIRITPERQLWKKPGRYLFYCEYDETASLSSSSSTIMMSHHENQNTTSMEIDITKFDRGNFLGKRGDLWAAVMAIECPYYNDTYVLSRVPVVSRHALVKRSILDNNNRGSLTPVVVNYNVALPAKCAHKDWHDHQKYTLPALDYPPKYAACVLLYGNDKYGRYNVYDKYRQWIAYNRAVGVDHFFVYLKEPWPLKGDKDSNKNNETVVYLEQYLPSAPYITYLPFDIHGLQGDPVTYGGGTTEKNFFQPMQQSECIHRARTWFPSLRWVITPDIDEYPQVMIKTPRTPQNDTALRNAEDPEVTWRRQHYPLKRLFEEDPTASFSWNVTAENNVTTTTMTISDASDGSLDQMRLQMPHLDWVLDLLLPLVEKGTMNAAHVNIVWFGENRRYHVEESETNNDDFVHVKRHVLEYVYSASRPVTQNRQKNWCSPWNVIYHHMHHVTEGYPSTSRMFKMDATREMRLAHFKQPNRGVRRIDGDDRPYHIVHDTSLRDTYLQVVRAMLEQMEFYYDSDDGRGIEKKRGPAPAIVPTPQQQTPAVTVVLGRVIKALMRASV